MNPETLKLLGLPPDATDDEVSERIATLGAAAHERDTLQTKLAAQKSALEANAAALAALQAKQLEEKIAALELQARSEGKFAPGSALNEQFHRLAKLDVAEAEAFVASLPKQGETQVGAGLQSTHAIATPRVADGVDRILADDYGVATEAVQIYKHAFAQLGLTEKVVAEFGPEAIRRKQKLHRDDWSASLRGMVPA